MMPNGSGSVRELEEWLRASNADAARQLPDLLDLPPAVLRREMVGRAELRTAGMMEQLIALAQDALVRYPRRAYELTSILLDFAPMVEVPTDRAVVVVRLHASAWKEHARALCALNRSEEAREALTTARGLYKQTPAHDWYVATVDLLEAPLVHDGGDAAGALELVRRAGAEFALHHDYEHLVEARMLEVWMHCVAGNDVAADDVFTATADLAYLRRHPTLLARMTIKQARFHLRRGNAEVASRMFKQAAEAFEREGLMQEAIRTRWYLAESLTARSRIPEAISEYHKVWATLLDSGATNDAAIAAAEAVELLLVAGRDAEVPALTETLVDAFRPKLTQNALEALTYLDARAAAGTITRDDATTVRRYFEDLRQQPHARFHSLE